MGEDEITEDVLFELLMQAWGVIANVSEGDWTKQNSEWQDAAVFFRDQFHEALSKDVVRNGEVVDAG